MSSCGEICLGCWGFVCDGRNGDLDHHPIDSYRIYGSEQDRGRPLPKFGEWDVNNPASAEGFTVIFNKARDEKKTSANASATVSPQKPNVGYKQEDDFDFPTKSRKWFCCG